MPLKSISRTTVHRGLRRGTRSVGTSTNTPLLNARAQGRTKVVIPKGLPMTDSLECSLTYCDTIDMTSTSGGVTNFGYRANSVFDPQVTIGGHQPYEYDQLNALFHRVLVLGVAYDFRFVNQSATPVDICSGFTTATLGSTAPRVAREYPYFKFGMLGAADGGQPIKSLKGKISMGQLMGVNLKNANNDYTHTDGGNPAQDAFLLMMTQSTDQASTAIVRCHIKIVYRVSFFDRRTNAAS